jgi:hypothetical protein
MRENLRGGGLAANRRHCPELEAGSRDQCRSATVTAGWRLTISEEDADRGTPALLVVGSVLLTAAEMLAGEQAARECLKVSSGEHLAAIFLSGLFGRIPSGFDDTGGPDLVFDACPGKPWFPFTGPAFFEVKSLPGAYRRTLSTLARKERVEQQAGTPFSLRLWTAAEVMTDARPTILRAERSLVDKTPPRCSRNVFLITHPFDHFALDVAQAPTVSHLMPSELSYDALDTVWVFWPPGKLVMWSSATRIWTDILFATHGGEIPYPDDTLSFIQNIELTYMATAGIEASPYVFNLGIS